MSSPCVICQRHVHSHSLQLVCSYCRSFTHLKCLPQVDRNDSLYTDRHNNSWFCMACVKDLFPFNHFCDDSDFICAITDEMKGNTVDVNELNERYDSFLNIAEEEYVSPISDNDPDVNYFNEYNSKSAGNCSYYDENGFCKKYSEINDSTTQNFSLMHVNIRSAQKIFRV